MTFNLSDKRQELLSNTLRLIEGDIITVADIFDEILKQDKEFIKLAREMLDDCMSGGCDRELVLSNFDKLAGDKLI